MARGDKDIEQFHLRVAQQLALKPSPAPGDMLGDVQNGDLYIPSQRA